MGKKHLKVQADPEEEEDILNDPDFEAEMKALESLRAEREADQGKKQDDAGSVQTNKNGYNRDALMKCVEDSESAGLPFVETLRVDEFDLTINNELDDVEREMNFYNHALSAVHVGRAKLQEIGYPIHRPTDYFCEQVKSDTHMARIKDRLLIEEKRMEAFEQRKNREQNRKYNKQLAVMKKESKNKEKDQLMEEIEELKDQAKERGADKTHTKYLDKDAQISKDEKLEKILNSRDRDNSKFPEQSKKRKIMDKKYGHGGRDKKRAKLNDAKSLNDFSDFNPKGGKFVRERMGSGARGKGGPGARGGAGAGARGGKGKTSYRPGKDTRQKSRQRKGN